jgi:hypothetical protein
MFDFLYSAELDDAEDVVHYTIRLLEWRSAIRKDWLFKQLSAKEKKLVTQAVNEIEQTEKTSLYKLSQRTSERYIVELASIVRGRFSATMTDADRKWARKTLARWERETEFPLKVVRKKQRSPRAVKTNGKRRVVEKHPN